MAMSENPSPVKAAPAKPPRRGGPSQIRMAKRLEKVRRDERIVGLLNRGASVPEIAASEGLTLKRMRNLVREILAERMPQPPAEFLALQVNRLNEALLVSFTAMHDPKDGTNFEAVDRVVKIVRELDRYHGFAAGPRPREDLDTTRLPSAERPLALEGPGESDSRIPPQALEKAQSGLADLALPLHLDDWG
jgi:hypothetical protein